MTIQQPGMNMEGAFANALLSDDSVSKEFSEEMLCALDVWVDDVSLETEDRPGCVLPSPVLYLTGHVLRIRGISLPVGPTELVYPMNPQVELEDEEDGAIKDEGMMPIIAARGPEVRFRYEFTPAEKVRLVECGIMEPGFEVPSILTQNKLETMPVNCRFMSVMPEGEDEMPFIFCEIPGRSCIDTSANDCGYRLADYFKESVVMQKFMDMLVPVVEIEQSEALALETMDDDLLADYASAEIEADKAKEAEAAREAEEPTMAKVLSDNPDASSDDELEQQKDDGARSKDNEPPVVSWSDTELDATAVDDIARAYMEGKSIDDAVRDATGDAADFDDEETDDEKSRARKQRMLRQRGLLENAENEHDKEVKDAAKEFATAEDIENALA